MRAQPSSVPQTVCCNYQIKRQAAKKGSSVEVAVPAGRAERGLIIQVQGGMVLSELELMVEFRSPCMLWALTIVRLVMIYQILKVKGNEGKDASPLLKMDTHGRVTHQ